MIIILWDINSYTIKAEINSDKWLIMEATAGIIINTCIIITAHLLSEPPLLSG